MGEHRLIIDNGDQRKLDELISARGKWVNKLEQAPEYSYVCCSATDRDADVTHMYAEGEQCFLQGGPGIDSVSLKTSENK
ncbi:hypothetical protein RB195_020038 [Necator americanus]|uniref:Uncharacterized protein n=1 Tax=Necator americanus TaxID=51031 RepID=A0ABR1CGY1_NECAM